MKELMLQMKAFAKGEKIPSTLHEKKDELCKLARAGLGGSIARQIIEKYGGKIGFASDENEGTAIICWSPKKEE